MNSFIKWCVFLTLVSSGGVALGQEERKEIDSLIQSSFEEFREVANEQRNVNTLRTDQVIIWHALNVVTGTEGGKLNYANVEPFDPSDLQRWEVWYNKSDSDIKELIIVIKVLEKIYSGDYSEEYLSFIEGIEKNNKKGKN